MIWKMLKNRKIRYSCLGLFLFVSCLFCGSFCSSKASAFNWVTNPTFTMDKLTRQQSGGLGVQVITNEGNTNIPWTILGANTNNPYKRAFFGFLIYVPLNQYNYDYQDYTSIILDFTLGTSPNSRNFLLGPNSFSTNAKIVIYDTNGHNHEAPCALFDAPIVNDNFDYVKYRCQANFEKNARPAGVHVRFDPLDVTDPTAQANYGLAAYNSNSFVMSYLGFQINSDQDSTNALVRETNEINRSILQQIQTLYGEQISQLQQDLQDRNNVQDTSDDATTQGNNASANAQNATSSLLGAITNIYGVLLQPQLSNCDVGPINLYGQLDLGTLDMCTFDMPQPLMAVGALLLIGLVILLAWSVLNAGMSLYKDLFGGGK